MNLEDRKRDFARRLDDYLSKAGVDEGLRVVIDASYMKKDRVQVEYQWGCGPLMTQFVSGSDLENPETPKQILYSIRKYRANLILRKGQKVLTPSGWKWTIDALTEPMSFDETMENIPGPDPELQKRIDEAMRQAVKKAGEKYGKLLIQDCEDTMSLAKRLMSPETPEQIELGEREAFNKRAIEVLMKAGVPCETLWTTHEGKKSTLHWRPGTKPEELSVTFISDHPTLAAVTLLDNIKDYCGQRQIGYDGKPLHSRAGTGQPPLTEPEINEIMGFCPKCGLEADHVPGGIHCRERP